MFGKANSGIGSFGAFVIAGVDGDHVLLEQAEPMTFERLFERVIGTRTFLLQAFIQNHPTNSGIEQICCNRSRNQFREIE